MFALPIPEPSSMLGQNQTGPDNLPVSYVLPSEFCTLKPSSLDSGQEIFPGDSCLT